MNANLMTRNGNSCNERNAERDSNKVQKIKPFNFEWVMVSLNCNLVKQTYDGLMAYPVLSFLLMLLPILQISIGHIVVYAGKSLGKVVLLFLAKSENSNVFTTL